MIPYGRQNVTKDDIEAVIEVLKSDFLTQGPIVPKFENMIKDYCNIGYAVALNSATSALHAACFALGVKSGDIVWTAANTFVASANCALYSGAEVDFVDINANTYNICIDQLESKLKESKIQGNLPKVLIPVHLTGQSCDMEKIFELSKEYKFKIIEDASHSIGGKYDNEKIGSCRYSDITIFSFHPVKIITSGEGGIATTKSIELAKKMELFRSHGITRDQDLMHRETDGPWYYEQIELGYNYRMTDIHAALGISQLKRIDDIIIKRHEIAKHYDKNLADVPLKIPLQSDKSFSSYHLYVIRLKLNEISISHKEVFEQLRNEGILVNLHYIPVYFHPYYRNLGFKKGYCPEAEKYYSEAISIPIFPTLEKQHQEKVIGCIKKIVN